VAASDRIKWRRLFELSGVVRPFASHHCSSEPNSRTRCSNRRSITAPDSATRTRHLIRLGFQLTRQVTAVAVRQMDQHHEPGLPLRTPQHPGGPDSRGLPPREPGARLLHDRRWMTVRLITAAEAVVEPNILRVGGGDVGPWKLGCAGSPTLPVQMPFDRPRPGADTSHPTRPSSSGLTTTMQCRSFGFKVRNRRAAQLDEAANITVTRSSG